MAWDKAKDRALAHRATIGRILHNKGTYVRSQGFVPKPNLAEEASKPITQVRVTKVSPPQGPDSESAGTPDTGKPAV